MKLNLYHKEIRKHKWTLLLLFVVALSGSTLAQNGDVFLLVDVSASMGSKTINQEARKIVLELVQGNFSRSNWELKKWSEVSAAGDFFSNPVQSMLHDKGVFCLMPFGNMETVRRYKVMTYNSDNNQSFLDFYNGVFPTSHNEKNTYLSLAKAYSVAIAAQKELQGKIIWLIVYSDGMGDCMPSNVFPSDLQDAWDKFGTTQASIMNKKGTLRKYDGTKHYDIEVWTMGPIPEDEKKDDTTRVVVLPPEHGKFKITSPSNGISEQTAIEIKKDDKLNLSWINNIGSVTMSVQSIMSGKPKKIDNPKDYYTKTVSARSGNIIFHKSGVYKITIKDSKMSSDSRYVKVTSSPPVMTILLILLAVAGLAFAIHKIINPGPKPGPTPTPDDNWG